MFGILIGSLVCKEGHVIIILWTYLLDNFDELIVLTYLGATFTFLILLKIKARRYWEATIAHEENSVIWVAPHTLHFISEAQELPKYASSAPYIILVCIMPLCKYDFRGPIPP